MLVVFKNLYKIQNVGTIMLYSYITCIQIATNIYCLSHKVLISFYYEIL